MCIRDGNMAHVRNPHADIIDLVEEQESSPIVKGDLWSVPRIVDLAGEEDDNRLCAEADLWHRNELRRVQNDPNCGAYYYYSR